MRAAWGEVLPQLAEARRFGSVKQPGGEILGWWPSKPGERDTDDQGRVAWIHHKIFEPLSRDEVAQMDWPWLAGGIPASIRDFLTHCSNGLVVAAGDLTLLGKRRKVELDPGSDWSAVGIGDAQHLRIGTWGREYIWMDPRSGSVGAGATGSRYRRNWDTLSSFLVEACKEHLASFDSDGKRLAFAALPELRKLPKKLEWIAPGLRPRLDRLTKVLAAAPQAVTVAGGTYRLFKPGALVRGQVGYAVDAEGSPFPPTTWRGEWVVVGAEQDLGDPLIADLSTDEIRLMTAAHGSGRWDTEVVAPSVDSLLR